jgi:hypothetical protein
MGPTPPGTNHIAGHASNPKHQRAEREHAGFRAALHFV